MEEWKELYLVYFTMSSYICTVLTNLSRNAYAEKQIVSLRWQSVTYLPHESVGIYF